MNQLAEGVDQLTEVLSKSIISTLTISGIPGKIPPPLDIGIKVSLNGIGNTLRSIIPGIGKDRKGKQRYHTTIEHEDVIITADVPGIPRKNIHIISTENSVNITAEYKDRSYSMLIHFKERIDPYSIQKKCSNGVLVLRYRRIKPPTSILTAT